MAVKIARLSNSPQLPNVGCLPLNTSPAIYDIDSRLGDEDVEPALIRDAFFGPEAGSSRCTNSSYVVNASFIASSSKSAGSGSWCLLRHSRKRPTTGETARPAGVATPGKAARLRTLAPASRENPFAKLVPYTTGWIR